MAVQIPPFANQKKEGLQSMSGTSETAGSERPCGLSSLLPLGMSCRGRAEAFARRLQSRLRTLGTQGNTPITVDNNLEHSENSWLTQNEQQVTNIQPLRNLTQEADSFFDFDIDNESPGSPAEECEYSRLIETASTTPHDGAPESGYVCASPISPEGSVESQSSSDGPYFDPESSDAEQRSITGDYYDCIDSRKEIQIGPFETVNSNAIGEIMANGHIPSAVVLDSDSCSESLPPSQSTDTCTAPSSASNSTLQDVPATELEETVIIIANEAEHIIIPNGHAIQFNSTDEIVENHITNDEPLEKSENAEISSIEKQMSEKLILECLNIVQATPENSPEPESKANLNENNDDDGNDHQHLSVNASSCDEDDNDENHRPQRVRRCSSLKTGKTPPGTPGRKKIVRFADVLGLDLADVRTFLDEIPKIPKQAFDDLEIHDHIDANMQHTISLGPRAEKLLMPLFQQPASLPNFLDMVRDKQVCMENAAVTDPICLTITGCVRVRNLDFNKSVHVRYSLDNWKSFADLQANYVENSCDGFSDKFSFILFGNALQVGQRLEMACRLHCRGQQYWDNNYGQNYVFQCLPTTHHVMTTTPRPPLASTEETWCRSFY